MLTPRPLTRAPRAPADGQRGSPTEAPRFMTGYSPTPHRHGHWATRPNWRLPETDPAPAPRHAAMKIRTASGYTSSETTNASITEAPTAPRPGGDGVQPPLLTPDALPRRIVVDSPYTSRHLLSYGIAACAADTGRWLLVRPTTSPNFSCILRGFFRVSDLENMVLYITRTECEEMSACCNIEDERCRAEAFRALYTSKFAIEGKKDEIDYAYAFERFEQCRKEIAERIKNSSTERPEIDWTWPKGRRNGATESTRDAALREFREETGLDSKDLIVVTQEPIGEFYRSNNGRIYETQCWVAVLPREVPPPPVTEVGEIAERRWFSVDELCKMFAPTGAGTPLSHSSRLTHFQSFIGALTVSRNCETLQESALETAVEKTVGEKNERVSECDAE